MLVWSLVDERGQGLVGGLVAMGVLAIPAVALLRARSRFAPPEA
jgi:hypothetical protein